MALPLLPESLILQAFDDLFDVVLQAASSEYDRLKPLFEYFENHWIRTVGLKIRTNNNAEGSWYLGAEICS